MLKVYVENQAKSYEQMFANNGWKIVDNVDGADLLQLIGGADIDPTLYGEERHPRTSCSAGHDITTKILYNKALENGIPIAGICRGSQFLCAMGGGKLWQHVDGHAVGVGHNLLDVETGIVIEGCSSTHHQQHRPASNAIIIAEAFPRLTTIKETGSGIGYQTKDDTDIEAFYYPHINSLGYQPHPEFFLKNHPCQMYYFDIIAKYLKLRSE